MEARWWCPTCGRTVDDHEGGDPEDGDLSFV